jgi:uncharacterized membrane protein
MPVRIIVARPRLFLSILAGIAVGVLLPLYVSELRGVTRFLVAWDFGVGLYLVLAFRMIARSGVREIHRQYLAQDEGGFAILVLTIVSACASVGAVFAWLEIATKAETFALPGLAFLLLTIMLSWAFIHTMFALHYAHEFYGEDEGSAGGLAFPGGDSTPDYWDFVYFAFVVGMTSQVSDVAITSREIRRTVTAHGIVSFVFNVALLALTINIASGMLTTG